MERIGPSVKYPTIDYQDIIYYPPKQQKPRLNSLEEVDSAGV